MSGPKAKGFQPDWATHPGEHLAEHIEAKGWSHADLAARTGLAPKLISDIINQVASLTPESALKLETALEPKAEIWLGIQSRWDLHHARKRLRDAASSTPQLP
jgi:HTH-type transcriptional regulator / antitoxin HigA